MRKLAAVVAVVFAVTGCAATASVDEAPQPVEATENQVASVIAEYEEDWRAVSVEAAECRLVWTLDSPDDPLSNAKGTSCYLREQTATIRAELAIRDLNRLVIPSSMEELVSDTIATLQPLSNANIVEVCGDEAWPANTDECNKALGSLFAYYNTLDSALDRWRPYL